VASDSFSYTGSPVKSERVHVVRLMIGDTDPLDQLLTDDEILLTTTAQPSNTFAAAACADFIAAKFARRVSTKMGAISISADKKYQQYAALADRLRASGGGDLPGGDGSGTPTVTMFVGGVSIDQREALRDDDDRIQSSFSVGQDDHPGVASSVHDLDRRD